MSHLALIAVQSSLSALPSSDVLALGPKWLDPMYLIPELVGAMGLWAVAAICLIIFAECGLLVGFFLPGDSLLFTAGLFIATGVIDIPLWVACTALVVSALLGNISGYWIGRAAGPTIFDRPDSKLFRREYVEKTHEFFEKYGNRAVVLGRFVPVVRTFLTVMAGVAKMDARRYLTFSLLGGVVWAAGVTLLGYWLGGIPVVREHIELMLILVVAVSILPLVFEFVRSRRQTSRDDSLPAPGGSHRAGRRP
ncbi:MAG TPA: VTT domain-containing protein [Pseudonocardia sp.]|nr:VTT domain-containing protein [Pseudonocardia sp.]